jgi:hypothetical protein
MKTPNSVIFNNQNEIEKFDKKKFVNSIVQFGECNIDILEKGLEELSQYNPVHVSRLIELGINCLTDEESAKKYYERYYYPTQKFERLRRITGYLVGTLDRWNDGKKAEEKERVKHTIIEKQQKEQMKFTQEKALGKI